MDERLVVTALSLVMVPAALIGAGIGVRRLSTLARHAFEERSHRPAPPDVASAPIEKLAATLGRLLEEHRQLSLSSRPGVRMHHLRALEFAVAYCALDAAIALDIPRPASWERGTVLTTTELGGLLRSLAAAGLAMPRDDLLLAGLYGSARPTTAESGT